MVYVCVCHFFCVTLQRKVKNTETTYINSFNKIKILWQKKH